MYVVDKSRLHQKGDDVFLAASSSIMYRVNVEKRLMLWEVGCFAPRGLKAPERKDAEGNDSVLAHVTDESAIIDRGLD